MHKLEFINNQGWWRITQLFTFIQNIIASAISLAGIFIVLYKINPMVVLVLFISCLPSLWMSKKYGEEAYFYELHSMKEKWYVDYHAGLATGFNKEVRFFNLFEYIKNEWKIGTEILIKKRANLSRKFTVYRMSADLVKNIAIIISLYIIAFQIVEKHTFEIGTFVLILTLSANIQNNMWTLLWSLGEFNTHSVYIKDYFDIANLECENNRDSNEVYNTMDIEFRNVSFIYNGSKNYAINNLNVKIKQGEKIAIIGENGSGKTTFIKLLTGIYDCDEGEILVNGEPLAKNLSKLRNSVSVIFQDYARYKTNIKENIVVGAIERNYTKTDIEEVAKKTDIHTYIEGLENGYDTEVFLTIILICREDNGKNSHYLGFCLKITQK